jgi:hypothetical protein
MFKNSGWALAHFNLKPGRVSLKDTGWVDPTLFLFSSRPLSFFFISLFSLSLMARTKATMAKVLVLSLAPCTASAAHHSPPAVEDFGSAFCLSLSLSLSFLRFFSFLSLSPSRLLRLPSPPPLSQTHGSLSLSTSRSW